MSTTTENFGQFGIKTITRCDRCNGADGWGVSCYPVINPVNGVESDYCTHCLIVRSGDECRIKDCMIGECYSRNYGGEEE